MAAGDDRLRPLQDWLDQRPLLEVPACVALVVALLEALDEVHALGQIQHSLDPRAVIVRWDGDSPAIEDLGPATCPTRACRPGPSSATGRSN